jgi:hypothetical protein
MAHKIRSREKRPKATRLELFEIPSWRKNDALMMDRTIKILLTFHAALEYEKEGSGAREA